jgi:hypothetical protein
MVGWRRCACQFSAEFCEAAFELGAGKSRCPAAARHGRADRGFHAAPFPLRMKASSSDNEKKTTLPLRYRFNPPSRAYALMVFEHKKHFSLA